MTITARFASICPSCSQPIAIGAAVEWSKGSKARHTSCPTSSTPAAEPPAKAAPVVTYETVGQRVYVMGDTYAIRGAIKSVGGHWDAERKAWWIGAAKREVLTEAIVAAEPETTTTQHAYRPTTCIVCGYMERRNARGYLDGDRILRSGECQSCYEERKMGY